MVALTIMRRAPFLQRQGRKAPPMVSLGLLGVGALFRMGSIPFGALRVTEVHMAWPLEAAGLDTGRPPLLPLMTNLPASAGGGTSMSVFGMTRRRACRCRPGSGRPSGAREDSPLRGHAPRRHTSSAFSMTLHE